MIFYGQKKNLNYIIFVPKIQLFQSFGVFNSVIVLINFFTKTDLDMQEALLQSYHSLPSLWHKRIKSMGAYILARIGRYENRRAREYPPMSYFYISIFYKLCLEKQTPLFIFLIQTPGALFMEHEQCILAYEQ